LKARNKRIGSSFDDFLKEEGIYDEAVTHAIKRVLAWQLTEAMKARNISKNAMAKQMKTSRTQIARLLDPDNDKVSLEVLQRAASIVGKRVTFSLENV
jgi:antitoxin HicB